MAKIHTLKISNYRGIQKFEQVFGMTDFVCLIGRGDAGKSTILEAISAVLSPSWSLPFFDTDFYNGVVSTPIEIEASLYDPPEELLRDTKYGLYTRGLVSDGTIRDDLQDGDALILTIKLVVDETLEPKWYVVNNREGQEPIEIRASDRTRLNVFLVSDYLDKHFSWNKGNPLYSLLMQDEDGVEKTNVIVNALRDAKNKIDEAEFKHLDNVVTRIKKSASAIGIDIEKTKTTIDFKDIFIKDGKVCLHDEKIPFRQKGKGAKRLISIAIQTELARSGGIVLIDEIEQGLEPDRAKHLVKALQGKTHGQVFITTHSRDVLVELSAENIFLSKNGSDKLVVFDEGFQGCLRRNPEAFFAKKILVCEGATEVGIARTIDHHKAEHDIQPVIDYLKDHPDATIHISGNTGATGETFIEGNSPEALGQVTDVNGHEGTMGELQVARARAVEAVLIKNGIDPKRITVGTGTHRNKDENRRVGINIRHNAKK